MIECIFTVDYEIYGNGEGSLRELVYEPAERLMSIFWKRNARFVPFVEVAELEMIDAKETDPAIGLVKEQLRAFYRDGYELGLHIHPQWYNGCYENGRWLLDNTEYNLCTLPKERIAKIVDRAIAYLRQVLGVADFTPLSFRAGNWLFQPTMPAAGVLAARGIKVDSSVFSGGLQQEHGLDYRRALKNGYYWPFGEHVDIPALGGPLLELPIHTQMVPTWKMLTSKRIGLQRKASSSTPTVKQKLYRLLDYLHPWHPLKFDFCRMTLDELTHMVDVVICENQKDVKQIRPIVAIGHTKDLVDFKTVDLFLSHLENKDIPISSIADVYRKCITLI